MKAKIIGCGLSGIVSAIILKHKGYNVEIFETRNHIGGNCYDEKINDITVHKYGPHIFHTNDDEVWNFVNRYSSFNNYIHKTRANTIYGLISIPYNYNTRDQIGKDLSIEEIQKTIFQKYSERHWGITLENLPKNIINRLHLKRNNYDDRYFTDKYQGIPQYGYTNMFHNMVDDIKINLNVEPNYYKRIINKSNHDIMIYTAKLDDYFDYEYGNLGYRSLRLEHTISPKDKKFSWYDGAIINECNDSLFNRTIDNSVFLNEQLNYTIITRDFPQEHSNDNEPFYPKNFGSNIELYNKYHKLISSQKKTIFLGRLATYKYLDMWMVIRQVLNKLNKI